MSLASQIYNDLKSGAIKAESALKLRDERKQKKNQMAKIQRLKRELKLREKLLFPMEIAVPFNPMTGQADDQYNEENKWRPPVSATTAALVLKRMASENDVTRQAFIDRAGMSAWDVSDLETLTAEDKLIFRNYRVLRVFSLPVVSISEERITGNKYPNDYVIDVKRDSITQAIEGDWPLALEANKLYRDLAFEESAHIDECIELAKEGKPYEIRTNIPEFLVGNLADKNEKQIKEGKKGIWKKVIISDDRPSNNLVVVGIPLNNDLTLKNPEVFNTITSDEIKKMLKTSRKVAELDEPFDNFTNGTWNKYDEHFDFLELDMLCPTQVDDPDDKMQIGKETRYMKPETFLSKQEWYGQFCKAYREAIDSMPQIENQFMYSVYVRKMDSSVEKKLLAVMEKDDLLNHPFMTEKVLLANSKILSKVYGPRFEEMQTSLDVGLAELRPGALDDKEAELQSKQSLSDIINGTGSIDADEDGSVDNLETDIIVLDE